MQDHTINKSVIPYIDDSSVNSSFHSSYDVITQNNDFEQQYENILLNVDSNNKSLETLISIESIPLNSMIDTDKIDTTQLESQKQRNCMPTFKFCSSQVEDTSSDIFWFGCSLSSLLMNLIIFFAIFSLLFMVLYLIDKYQDEK